MEGVGGGVGRGGTGREGMGDEGMGDGERKILHRMLGLDVRGRRSDGEKQW